MHNSYTHIYRYNIYHISYIYTQFMHMFFSLRFGFPNPSGPKKHRDSPQMQLRHICGMQRQVGTVVRLDGQQATNHHQDICLRKSNWKMEVLYGNTWENSMGIYIMIASGNLTVSETALNSMIPSGELSHSNGKIHHFSWENPLFLWPCSIAMLVHQRVYPIKFH